MTFDGFAAFFEHDAAALAAAVLAALSCSLLGTFLVLRRLSMMGDAISHAVLPGIIVAYLITGDRSALPMLAGALAAGVVTVIVVEFVQRVGRVESGAAMGVTFSVLFALGVWILRAGGLHRVDLDADCVLNGNLDGIRLSPAPDSWDAVIDLATLEAVPREVTTLAGMAAIVLLFVVVLYKELRIASFDPGLATALGFAARRLHYLLMTLVAAAAVVAFEAVGSILVVAMFITPAATARLLTDRLVVQLALGGTIAMATAVVGYFAAAFGPRWVGLDNSVNAAGMMTVFGFVGLGVAVFLAPSHGILARRMRRLRLAATVAAEDLVGVLYRLEELGERGVLTPDRVSEVLGGRLAATLAIRHAVRGGHVERRDERLTLTEAGRDEGRAVIRSHRLWETYLAEELGLPLDHVHHTAEWLEHLRRDSQQRLEPRLDRAEDPHGRPIPGHGE